MAMIRRLWTQDTSFDEKKYLDTVTFYDGGDFIGLLQQTSGGKQWSGFSIVERKGVSPTSYQELLLPAHDFFVPLGFFAIETYPARMEGSTLWIPGWKVQTLPLNEQPTSGSPSQLQSPQLQKTLHPKRRQPDRQPSQSPLSPSSQPPLKVLSEKPKPSQRPSQNKSKTLPKQKVSLSSDQASHATPKLSDQEKRAASPLPPSPIDHIVQQSQWYPLFQLSLSPRPHEDPVGSTPLQASSSRPQTNSGQRLPSRQVQPQSANKSRRPTFAKKPSHGQTAQVPGTAF